MSVHSRIVVLLIASLVWGPAAMAQDAEVLEERELKMQDGAFVIEGKVQKPEVVVVVSRDTLDASLDLGLDRTFLDRVVDALDDPPVQD